MDCVSNPFALQPAPSAPSPTSPPSSLNTPDPALVQAIADVQKQLGTMLVKAGDSIRSRALAIHPDLQAMGFKVLTILSQSGPMQQVALAHKAGTDKAVMSRTITQLESLGLVARTADPSDGRALLVTITPEAQRRLEANTLVARKVLFDRMSSWNVGELHRFADLLARLNQSGD